MRHLLPISLALLVLPLQAEELRLDQLIALMETNSTQQAEAAVSAPEAAPQVEKPAVAIVPEAALSAGELQLAQIVALAQANDARLAPYSSALKLAQYRNDASLQRDNPELRLGTGLEGNPELSASVRFFPLHPWQSSAVKGENSAIVEAEAAAYRNALLETTVEAVTSYHELQCLEREKELYDRLVDIKQGFAARVDQQVAASMGTQAQGLLAHWEALESLENRRNTEIETEQLKQSLAALTGQPSAKLSIAPLTNADSFTLIDSEKSTRIALSHRPEIQLLKAQRAAADARLRGAKAASIPWLNHVEVGYRNKDRGWQLEAAFDLPVYTLGGTDKMLAYEEVSLRNIELETQEQVIGYEVESAVKAYNLAVNEWSQLHERQVDLMKKTRDYLARVTSDDPQRLEERLALEEKLIRAEFKMLDIRRRINQTHMAVIVIVGQSI